MLHVTFIDRDKKEMALEKNYSRAILFYLLYRCGSTFTS